MWKLKNILCCFFSGKHFVFLWFCVSLLPTLAVVAVLATATQRQSEKRKGQKFGESKWGFAELDLLSVYTCPHR